jgi:hypothetical protein
MEQNLTDYLKGKKCKGFRPVPHYHSGGDFVSFFFKPDRPFARKVDNFLTVYLAMDSKELVGCKIDGVKRIVRAAEDYGLLAPGGVVRLGLLLFVGAMLATEEGQRARYEEVRRVARDAELDPSELQSAAKEGVS